MASNANPGDLLYGIRRAPGRHAGPSPQLAPGYRLLDGQETRVGTVELPPLRLAAGTHLLTFAGEVIPGQYNAFSAACDERQQVSRGQGDCQGLEGGSRWFIGAEILLPHAPEEEVAQVVAELMRPALRMPDPGSPRSLTRLAQVQVYRMTSRASLIDPPMAKPLLALQDVPA